MKQAYNVPIMKIGWTGHPVAFPARAVIELEPEIVENLVGPKNVWQTMMAEKNKSKFAERANVRIGPSGCPGQSAIRFFLNKNPSIKILINR